MANYREILAEKLRKEVRTSPESRYAGAFGAALSAFSIRK